MPDAVTGNREINVDGIHYRWSVHAIETVIDVVIEQVEPSGQKLRVGYYYLADKPKDVDTSSIIISELLVSKLIIFARKLGWEPSEFGLIEFFVYGEEVGPLEWSNQ